MECLGTTGSPSTRSTTRSRSSLSTLPGTGTSTAREQDGSPHSTRAPGATNTLDLIIEGDTALFGVNGEFVASLDLPDPTSFRIGVVTGLDPEVRIEGREIAFTLQVWY